MHPESPAGSPSLSELLARLGCDPETELIPTELVEGVFELIRDFPQEALLLNNDASRGFYQSHFTAATILEFILLLVGPPCRDQIELNDRYKDFDQVLPEETQTYIVSRLEKLGHKVNNAPKPNLPEVEANLLVLRTVLRRLIAPEKQNISLLFKVFLNHIIQRNPSLAASYAERVRVCQDPFGLIEETLYFFAENRIPYELITLLREGKII